MKSLKKRGRKSKRTELITYNSAAELLNLQRSCWRFSLTKPLVLPGVDKKALANKTPEYRVVQVCQPHHRIQGGFIR